MVVYRAADTPPARWSILSVASKSSSGRIRRRTSTCRVRNTSTRCRRGEKQLEDLKKTNAAALQANVLINQLNADLKVVNQDKKDIDSSATLAAQALGGNPSRPILPTSHRDQDRQVHRYRDHCDADTGLKPDEALLWKQLGYGQAGLKHYDDAIHVLQEGHRSRDRFQKPRMP